MTEPHVTVIGAGLAGSEAAWQAARLGVKVTLYEMRPHVTTAVHRTGLFAELVCSNSLRGAGLENAVGLLKEEMRRLGSLILREALQHAVPAGGALAVSREEFAAGVTAALTSHPNITVVREEVREIPPDGVVVIASGPLTSAPLAEAIRRFTGEESLAFYDAAAPIVNIETVNMDKVFRMSRYGKGEGDDYLNCPLTREEYEAFYEALVTAEKAMPHNPEDAQVCFFEGCLPVEEIARRGPDALRYGPMKPVGLIDPRTGRRPWAVVQLRQDNAAGTLYNMVGFQTSLKWSEQKRVFRMIPGLEEAEFERYGVIHRNTFMKSPRLLYPTGESRQRAGLFFAGQMTGVEGYVESAAGGLVAGINAARRALGLEPVTFPRETAIGSLLHYITHADPEHFQPMNIAFGLMPPLEGPKIRDKRARKRAISERALDVLAAWAPGHLGAPLLD
ncbi:methylenetetrahydrofolate--tRNA-(uracil(54)-C(5))-methyltransferase (FADH(2)-oxidizing) TrmFO [Symbiobacterium thermophilum]|uniref:Methylenetetrahydrofolate--tRNA-(uracil-5-)-methyltransferase TrmFO n=2 Tax=Symbiobacterium thermophilum TaxID=2734 RepID=TRMFO_SYMTH|nr:methylenetetrahydrofolate--tRNA-(uracil(54)-C(5))-methyltransferase (FADH(2)-oxidizing) TrmFO [Symbiobacterium thermophilum]Q67PC6.1 RecName: Full=Methylenetetrahydrofolate--tRNA-(uracil-5-)-methyltransferase TrmFO; AltName: Full=Folate-dependent tRNA (uracil-5-)-methyltransferase; AltName: Full=Folate-dependent tRNA(M-5-U54)-methyltransferase [Symbiobacterium thermophilum IAM 14863]BAD40467.1 glucose-inhibited division protein [Symbiobacterium thermophilum IAM 14863]